MRDILKKTYEWCKRVVLKKPIFSKIIFTIVTVIILCCIYCKCAGNTAKFRNTNNTTTEYRDKSDQLSSTIDSVSDDLRSVSDGLSGMSDNIGHDVKVIRDVIDGLQSIDHARSEVTTPTEYSDPDE